MIMSTDNHWAYDDEPKYIKCNPYERIQQKQKVVELELTSGDVVSALVTYHYTERSSSCSRMEPDDPASVEVISIHDGETGDIYYALDGVDTMNLSEKGLADLELSLLEEGV
jgi:hypothetical protein